MKRAILKIEIEKKQDGSFKDSLEISGTQVEVLGMIEKSLIIISHVKNKIVKELEDTRKIEDLRS